VRRVACQYQFNVPELTVSIRYRHRITKARAKQDTQPDERGGGILADEMGMGKSLSILALIAKTLDDGNEWAQQQKDGAEDKEVIKYSRATLVVVPSLRTRPSFFFSEWKPVTDLPSSHLQLDERDKTVRLFCNFKWHHHSLNTQALERGPRGSQVPRPRAAGRP
jgi:hypothetical protein